MADNYSSTNNGAGVFSTSLSARGLNVTPLTTPVSTSFSFGSGNDTINLAGGNNNIFLGDGNNAAFTGKGNDVIYGGSGRDIISAGDGSNLVYAGEGVNLITAGKGNDLIYAGSAGDFINAGDGRNTIFAGEGDNVILSGKGNDLVFAGAGNDRIFTGAGDDTIYAGNGKNIINAGTGNDKVFLGSGVDKLILESGKGFVTVVGFDVTSDKLRLGESLAGQALRFVIQGNDTLVRTSGNVDTKLAVLVGVKINSQSIVDRGTLYKYVATDLAATVPTVGFTGTLKPAAGSVNAASINDFGQIAGRADTGATYTTTSVATSTTPSVVNPNNIIRQAFIWENGVKNNLTSTGLVNGTADQGGTNGSTVTMLTPNVNKINNLGVITGTGDEIRQPVGKATDRALLWSNGSGTGYSLSINNLTIANPASGFGNIGGTDLKIQESYFLDINNTNQIAGRNISTEALGSVELPLSVANGVVTYLALPGGTTEGTTRGINDAGTIVGVTNGAAAGSNVGTIWKRNGSGGFDVSTLLPEGYEQSTLRDLNEAGTIIGQVTSGTGTAAISYGMVNANGMTTILNGLPGGNGSSTPNGINELGQVIGASNGRAFINDGGATTVDLNALLSTPLTNTLGGVTSPLTLTSAASINNFGQIVATGTYLNGSTATSTTTKSFVLNAVW
jgi:uncharacterized membrane protein